MTNDSAEVQRAAALASPHAPPVAPTRRKRRRRTAPEATATDGVSKNRLAMRAGPLARHAPHPRVADCDTWVRQWWVRQYGGGGGLVPFVRVGSEPLQEARPRAAIRWP